MRSSTFLITHTEILDPPLRVLVAEYTSCVVVASGFVVDQFVGTVPQVVAAAVGVDDAKRYTISKALCSTTADQFVITPLVLVLEDIQTGAEIVTAGAMDNHVEDCSPHAKELDGPEVGCVEED